MSIFGIVDYIIAFDYLLIQTDSAFMRKSRNANINFRNHKNFSIGFLIQTAKYTTVLWAIYSQRMNWKKDLCVKLIKWNPHPPDERPKRNRSQEFHKKAARKNFVKFVGRNLWRRIFLTESQIYSLLATLLTKILWHGSKFLRFFAKHLWKTTFRIWKFSTPLQRHI